MIEASLYTVLTGNATVARLVNTRVYPVVMPQDVQLPAVSYQRTSAEPVNTLDGYSGLKNANIVINSWARNYDDAKTLGKAVHVAMDAARTFRCVMTNELDGYDQDMTVFVVSQDFSCWGQE